MGVKVRERNGSWWIFIDHRGQRKAVKIGSKEAAKAKAKEFEGKLADGKLNLSTDTPAPVVFKDYAQKWLTGHVETNLKLNTRLYYASMLRLIPDELQRKSLDEITRDDIRGLAFQVLERLARSTARGVLRTISAVYTQAAEDGVYRGATPAAKPGRILRNDHVPGTVEKEDGDCMNEKEWKHFLEVARKHYGKYYPLFLAALRTGARPGELLAVTWDAIDWHGGFITIRQTLVKGKAQSTKSGRIRHVPMSPELIRTLKELHKEKARVALSTGRSMKSWVFQNGEGDPLYPTTIRKVLLSVLRKAGIRSLTFHSLRRSALTAMAENNVPMAVLQKIAGHSDITTTARYYLKVDIRIGNKNIMHALDALDGKGMAVDVAPENPQPPRNQDEISEAAGSPNRSIILEVMPTTPSRWS